MDFSVRVRALMGCGPSAPPAACCARQLAGSEFGGSGEGTGAGEDGAGLLGRAG